MAVVGGRGPAFGTTSTDAEGRYEIAHLPAGKIQFFSVRKDGYPPHPKMDPMAFQRGAGELKEGEVLTKDVTLAEGALVTGKVTDSVSGRPVAGAEVTAMSPMMMEIGGGTSAVSGEDGVYRLEGMGVGTHILLVKAPGFYQKDMIPTSMREMLGPAMSGTTPPADSPMVVVKDDVEVVEKDIEVLPGVTISGTVLAPDGKPVAGARVSFEGGGREMAMMLQLFQLAPKADLTNEAGEFRLTGTPGGDAVRVAAEAEGYVRGTSDPISTTAGGEATGIVVRLRAGGAVAGVVHGSDGSPLEGAIVRVLEIQPGQQVNDWSLQWQLRQAEAQVVDEAGKFHVGGLAPGQVLVAAEGPGHQATIKRDITVPEGGVSGDHLITLEKGLEIGGVVVDEAGEPLAGVRVWVNQWRQGGEAPVYAGDTSISTGEDGAFRVDSLPAGKFNLTFNLDGYARESANGIGSGTTDLRVTLLEGRTISGRVLYPDGSPAVRVQVSARGDDNNSRGTMTDDEGIEVDGIRPGTYRVTASPNTWGPQAAEAPDVMDTSVDGVSAGTDNVEIRFQTGYSISGVVVDESGAPIEGAGVSANPWAKDGGREGPNRWGQTDETGAFRLKGVDGGAYRLSAWKQGYSQEEQTAAKGGDTEVRMALKKAEPVPEQPMELPRPR
jgi:protocatechuate 3,4-dioxygenase beta subunit